MTRADSLRELYAFNDWGRDRLLAAAAPLSDEQLDRPFEMGPGSLRRTLHHLWAAEQVWLDRWKGVAKPSLIDPKAGLPIARLAERWAATSSDRNALLASLDADGLSKRVTFTTTQNETHTFTLADMMMHVVNHGVHHRAQAANMIRHGGGSLPPPGADYIFMRLEMSRREPPASAPSLDVATVRAYYAYLDWARWRVYDAYTGLTDEQLDRKFEMGLGSIRRTATHLYLAERWWLDNWTCGPGCPFPDTPDDMSLNELRVQFDRVRAKREQFLAKLADADLTAPIEAHPRPGVVRSFPLGVTMLQLCTHGTHHRAQVLNMLRHVGITPPKLDYILMVRQAATSG